MSLKNPKNICFKFFSSLLGKFDTHGVPMCGQDLPTTPQQSSCWTACPRSCSSSWDIRRSSLYLLLHHSTAAAAAAVGTSPFALFLTWRRHPAIISHSGSPISSFLVLPPRLSATVMTAAEKRRLRRSSLILRLLSRRPSSRKRWSQLAEISAAQQTFFYEKWRTLLPLQSNGFRLIYPYYYRQPCR